MLLLGAAAAVGQPAAVEQEAAGGEHLTTLAQVARLRKLNSFLKEWQRANPLQALTFRRFVLADTALYDDDDDDDDDNDGPTHSGDMSGGGGDSGGDSGGGGGGGDVSNDNMKPQRKPVTVLPRGLYIAATNSAIARDARGLGGSREFDGFRFERLAQLQQQQQQQQQGEKKQGLLAVGSRVGWWARGPGR